MDKTALPRCTPESQGIASAAVIGFLDEIEKNVRELHSFMLLRHGAVVAEGWWSPYGPHLPHKLFSLSKSFASTAVGLAVSEGLLSVNDTVVSFFPESLPAEPSENLRAMRVKQLLSMSTGHAEDTTERVMQQPDPDWVKVFLSLPVEFRPGTHFVYNTAATYMLSAIVQKVTGMKVLDYLQPRLLDPLGISGAAWDTSPQGVNMGGFGLNITTEDIARFGQLYLQKGKWNGAQIVPEAWVVEATARQVSNGSSPDSDWEQGYGYQFWRCRHDGYRGDGAFGQYCVVMPEQDAVIAITSGVDDMQQVLNAAWDCLLPAMGPAPLIADAGAQQTLQQRLAALKLAPPAGLATSPVAAQVSAKPYRLTEKPLGIESVSFDFSESGCVFQVNGAASPQTPTLHGVGRVTGQQQVLCGSGAWRESVNSLFEPTPQPAFASGVWTAEDTYTMTIRQVRTPFFYTFSCRFTGDQVEIQGTVNVSFGTKTLPVLAGKSE